MTDPTPVPPRNTAVVPRRTFLQTTALGLLGASALPLLGCSKEKPSGAAGGEAAGDGATPRPSGPATAKLGLQLYTVREQINADMPGTLKRLSGMGFQGVETAFWPVGVTVAQAAAALKEAGLSVASAHVDLPVGPNRQVMLDTAKAYGTKRMIWHGWPEDTRYRTIEGTMELVKIYNEINKVAKDNGLTFGLHNHWWEYRNKVGGRFVNEVLLDRLDPDIFFEVDTYWVKVAGQDPAGIVRQLGARAPFLHIKDGPAVFHANLAADNPDPMTPVGKGTLNFPAIAAAAAGNTEWMIVEMDKTVGDVYAAIEESARYLTTNNLAVAKPAA